jgi:glutamate/tyrosine decarboxylase-like PLP-dependent enzyme
VARRACLELAAGVREIPELVLRAEPDATLLAIGAADDDQLDVFAVADALWRRGWYVDRQGPPPTLHCTVSVVHDGRIDAFVSDLRASLDEIIEARRRGSQGSYGIVE